MCFFRGEKRANYLKKGKHAWKTQRFKNAKTVDMTRFLYVCIQRRIIYSPSHYDDMFILNTQAHARLDQMAQQFEVVCNGLNENEGQAIQTMDQSASLIRSNLIQVKEQLEKLAVY
ncbi:lipoprotein [Staphylococcus aureus]|nr:lipoprotein [Staphylococcus aureus]